MARDVLARLDPKGLLSHGEIAKLIGPQHVVGLEAFVEPVLGPYASHGRRGFEEEDIAGGIEVTVGLDGRKATPACLVSSLSKENGLVQGQWAGAYQHRQRLDRWFPWRVFRSSAQVN